VESLSEWTQVSVRPFILKPRIKSRVEVEKFNKKVEAGLAKQPRPKLGDPVQIAQMRKSGKSFASISRELGITQGIVQRRFEESGQDDPITRRLPLDMTEILRLRRDGESFTVIGRRFGVSQTTIYERIKEIEPSLLGYPRQETKPDPQKVVQMRESGITFSKIAHSLGCPMDRVWRCYYKTTKKKPKALSDVKSTPEAVLRLRKTGMTFDQIAAELSISKSNASLLFSRIRDEADPMLHLPMHRRYLLKAAEALALRQQGKTQREIATELGISLKAARKLCRARGE
jgi:transcriptional regulator